MKAQAHTRYKILQRRNKMIKWLKAIKVKDGWSVVIIEREQANSKSDVLRLIKQLGLEFKKEFSNDERIIAE